MGRYVGYSRISTREQSEHSLDNQLKYLKIQSKKIHMRFSGYKEKQSGKDSNRPVLISLIEGLEKGDILGVYDNSRLGRNTEENLRIVNDINSKGAKLQVNGKFIDIENPNDKLTLTIESAVSTYQRENQNLKSRIGIDSVKESGEWIFTSRMFGYRFTGTKRNPQVDIIDSEAEILRYIFDEYNKGESIFKITNELNRRGYRTRDGNKWHHASVRRYILKPIYMGYYKTNTTPQGGGHGQEQTVVDKEKLVKSKYYKPIISEELWWSCYKSFRTLRRTHQKQFKYRFSHYELASIIKCEYCGASYVHSYYKTTSKIHSYYMSTHCSKGCSQSRKTFMVDIFEPLFQNLYYLSFLWMEDVEAHLNNIQYEFKLDNSQVSEETKRIEALHKKLSSKIENLYQAIEKGLNHERTIPRIESMEREKDALDDRLLELLNKTRSIDEELEYLIDEYSDNAILRFVRGNTVYRRSTYLQSFEVSCRDDLLSIQYSTGMRIEISLRRNSRWDIQSDFELNIYRNNQFFTKLGYETKSEKYTIHEEDRVKRAALDILISNVTEKVKLAQKD